ncbi:hypothetical protein [Bacillus badius]|uniref:hypothetical protein n=1 Tax=Bacillus badius TaxID=1455 RepID=UPI0007B34165|nr:hypothetical protein [Bacillus badius]KZR59341.1 hypothetical protein A3781_13145 [Bacillus badius]
MENISELIIEALYHVGSATRKQLVLLLGEKWRLKQSKTLLDRVSFENMFLESNPFGELKRKNAEEVFAQIDSEKRISVERKLKELKDQERVLFKRIGKNATETYFLPQSELNKFGASKRKIENLDFEKNKRVVDTILKNKFMLEENTGMKFHIRDYFNQIIFINYLPYKSHSFSPNMDLIYVLPFQYSKFDEQGKEVKVKERKYYVTFFINDFIEKEHERVKLLNQEIDSFREKGSNFNKPITLDFPNEYVKENYKMLIRK